MRIVPLIFIALLVVVVCWLLVVGRSNKPSESEMELQIYSAFVETSDAQLFQFINFEKINGFQQDDGRVYIADIRYELEFKKGIEEIEQDLKIQFKKDIVGSIGSGLNAMALKIKYGDFKTGDSITYEEKKTFIKTENGWLLQEK